MVANELAAARIPVIIDAEDNEAYNWEELNATYENAGRLIRAGVTVAFEPSISRTMVLNRSPRLIAGRSVRFGVSRDQALAAITINPARIFGVADQVGSIERGKEASFVLWSGDPLDTYGVVRRVFIQGEEQPMDARSRLLRDRYIGTVLTNSN
jgi:imidazolonepropionase-like amidohydrolase